MSNQPSIRVTIPTYNNVDELDKTVQSVLTQAYDEERISILFADFGSTDGTLEKILHYKREWAGVFSLANKRIGRTMIADALCMWGYQAVPGIPFLLRPGDIIYPHCFETCTDWLKRTKRQLYDISYLVAETDILEHDGSIRKQSPLFSKPCRLRAHSEDSYEYVKKGYQHAVMTFGRPYSGGRDKPSTLVNLDFWWNRLAYLGFGSNILYINEPLGCLKAREPEDEPDDILFTFEQGLTMFRMIKELPDSFVAHDNFESAGRNSLAKFALWRSFLLYGQGKPKDAEDCFLLARIIHPAIEEEKCYRQMERLITQHDSETIQWLEEFFSREELPDNPKWPMGGMFTYRWQQLRQYFSKEKTSRFSTR